MAERERLIFHSISYGSSATAGGLREALHEVLTVLTQMKADCSKSLHLEEDSFDFD